MPGTLPDRCAKQDATEMKPFAKLLPPLALVGALALVPVTAASIAAPDTTDYQELEQFMSVLSASRRTMSSRSTTRR